VISVACVQFMFGKTFLALVFFAVDCIKNLVCVSGGSVSVFEVGICFSVFFKVGSVFSSGISKYHISVLVFFPHLHYFKSVCSLRAWCRPPTAELAQCRPL